MHENFAAFVNAGGKAATQMIIFDYNEDQTEDFKEFSYNMGASDVRYTISYEYQGKHKAPKKYVRDTGQPVCRSLDAKQISIDEAGICTPCCHNRPMKLKTNEEPWQMFLKDKDLLDLNKSTIEKAINSDFFQRFWLESESFQLCRWSCFEYRRFDVNKIG